MLCLIDEYTPDIIDLSSDESESPSSESGLVQTS